MINEIKNTVLAMVLECIEDEKLEKESLIRSISKTTKLEYAIRNGTLERIYFYDILITAMQCLPAYIENDIDDSFVNGLKQEIQSLTMGIILTSFTKQPRERLVVLEAHGDLIQKYTRIVNFVEENKHLSKCNPCNGSGLIPTDEKLSEWVVCDPCSGSGNTKTKKAK